MFTKNTTLKEKIENRFFKALKPLLYREAKQNWISNFLGVLASLVLPTIGYHIDSALAVVVGLPMMCILLLCGSNLCDNVHNIRTVSKSKNFKDLDEYINNIVNYATKNLDFSSELTSEEIQEIFRSSLNDNQMEYLVNLIANNNSIQYADYLHIETLFSKEDIRSNILKLEKENLEKKKLRELEIKSNIENFLTENNLPGQIRPHIIGNVIGQNIEKEFGEIELDKNLHTML